MRKSDVESIDSLPSLHSNAAEPSIGVYRNITIWRIEDFFVVEIAAALEQLYPGVVFEPSVEHVRLHPSGDYLVGHVGACAVEREHVVGRTDAIDRYQAHEHLRRGGKRTVG